MALRSLRRTAEAADAGVAAGDGDASKRTSARTRPCSSTSTDSSALNNWLSQNGFAIPAAVTPVIDAYVAEGFDFLAMKLLPNEGVQAMRPVRVTMPGASLSLPLRMAAVGTGATVGITIWVVSDGRYEPQNFPFFHIDDSALVWDWSTSISNYTTLRAQNEAALGGKGWEIESSIDLNEQLISSVIQSGGVYYGGGFGSAPPDDAGADYLPILAQEDGGADGGEEGGVAETADQVRADDIAALFAGMNGPTVRVTRMRSDISHAAMTADFVLQASPDQSELSNIRERHAEREPAVPHLQQLLGRRQRHPGAGRRGQREQRGDERRRRLRHVATGERRPCPELRGARGARRAHRGPRRQGAALAEASLTTLTPRRPLACPTLCVGRRGAAARVRARGRGSRRGGTAASAPTCRWTR